ncbi:bifunctional adenosylcobinamide kinase/adenosylcobinamide-phosphate guanylyltransferase [Vibrio hippocampi]|uniref:Bifunctional adenosylcobalamin biosynthesis protein n=1 Tax=Vibrio hippocampi TaxID=654686 RepID=A0ABN8DH49_9VIBR|nr:bifunctional adenosylcobinamide kinase/adenosylcobinamide-phosphate guanylyltransferase [Vibrio hippocampi]CAH0526120.1 Bifunctional adenosylcobalamin biosynthesis protein CobP [Vibrio hippocampi]
MSIELVLGGARSGKSRYAESVVNQALQQQVELGSCPDSKKHYVATAEAFDDEMRQRIQHHQRSRDSLWQQWQTPLELAQQLKQFDAKDIVLIDCLTLWMNNQIFYAGESCNDELLECKVQQLVEALLECKAHVVLVSNEVGLGVVPLGKVSRLFVDNAGRMNQRLASIADKVVFVAAGLPMTLKHDVKAGS